MARTHPPTSFSAGRRWGIFFSVLVSIAAVAALVLMLNYLGARHFLRFSWSAQTNLKLSPPTISLLGSITNDVKVTIYYDKTDPLYGYINDLLEQYHLANPKISVRTVDFEVDSSAPQIRDTYRLGDNKNLLIFECNGQYIVTSGELLANYSMEAAPADEQTDPSGKPQYEKHVQQFDGEAIVDAKLYSVIGPPMHACYLTGDGELPLNSSGDGGSDYSDFGNALANSHILTSPLSLAGTNTIPPDCNLLIIAGPLSPLEPEKLEKVREYLNEGGRLLVMFNYETVAPEVIKTGLEPILADWGVGVGMNYITDPENTTSGQALVVMSFNTNHPCVSPLVGSELLLYPARPIIPINVPSAQGQDPPTVVALAWTGPHAVINSASGKSPAPGPVPLMVAVEKKNVKGPLQRGTTRIIVTGDSLFLGKGAIDLAKNAEFAEQAARWLLDETQVMAGVAPRKVVDYRVMLTHSQMTAISWIFLGAMPGGILLLGWLVWLRRRH